MAQRLDKLMKQVPGEVDGVMIRSDLNRRYYTGFPSSAGTIIAAREKRWFIIDSRYIEAAQSALTGFEVILQDKLCEQLADLLKTNGIKTLWLEGDTTTLASYKLFGDMLPGVNIPADSGLSALISQQRAVKSPDEIASIAAAQEIAEKTFDYILGKLSPGMTEAQIALDMEMYSRKNGSEEAAFSFIIASGPNSSMPHAVPGGRKIGEGGFIIFDFGCTVNGYRSDMTRTVAVGGVTAKQREAYEIVLEAQLAALDAVKPGAVCKDIDKTARDIIDASPFRGCFGHGLGHSLGLAIHEEPRFSKRDETVLAPGMVLSVEPGVYLPGGFGVRIEDVVAVTETGCRNLMKCGKELVSV
ncbi:MAG: aminopeptidase P family protein [Oscillospiraceae bacterium]|nr:aminopeptidase P family protein [Oscillospiraceae bacterium]